MSERPHAVLPQGRGPSSVDEAEFLSESAEEQAARERIKQKNLLRKDQISDLLEAKYFVQNMTWPFIEYKGASLTVTRWYPERNVALDIFKEFGFEEKSEAEFKRRAFKKEGVRYAAIDWASEIAEIIPQIGWR